MKVDFIKPSIRREDILLMERSVKSGWMAPGKYTERFEQKLGIFLDNQATMVSSCTAALHLAVILAGVKKGDEVITTPLSWVATANVILYVGATPVFADVEPDTGLLDIAEVEKKITKKTKAIIAVHLYGQMVDMCRLSQLAKKHNIKVIEDSAHALEAERDGYLPGKLSFASCHSFHAAKNITSGNGGAIICQEKSRAKLLRRHGVENIDGKRVMTELGFKYEPTDFQAAMLIGQLERIRKTHAQRERVFLKYNNAFRERISSFSQKPNTVHACHMYAILVDPESRDEIRARLAGRGVETSIHYSPIHLEPYYQKLGFKKGSFPIAEKLGASIITLPTYQLTDNQQQHVIKEVLRCASHSSSPTVLS